MGLCWPSSSTRVINSLWPNDTICCHRTWSTLVQVMACNLTALSHYLNQCWLIIRKILCQSIRGVGGGDGGSQINNSDISHWYVFQNHAIKKLQPLFPKDQWVNATIQQTISKWFSVCDSYLQSKIRLYSLNDCNGSFLIITLGWETSISELVPIVEIPFEVFPEWKAASCIYIIQTVT